MLDHLDRLHTAPHVACQVLSVLQDEDFDIHELVGCLESDPALATSVLRLVNSSYFGLAKNVASLQQAVALLGSRSLRLAVLSFGLLDKLVHDTPAAVYQDFWRRSLTMAAASSQLTTAHNCPIRADEAYCGGLLADVGVLVFAQLQTSNYAELYERVGHTPLLVESERELYGFDHGQLGARLLARWNLPDVLAEAVVQHWDRVPDCGDFPLMLYAADLLADALWAPESPRVNTARELMESEFNMDMDGFITLAIHCKQTIKETAETYQVNLVGDIDCDQLLDQARRQYMDAAMEAAMDWDSLEAVAESS